MEDNSSWYWLRSAQLEYSDIISYVHHYGNITMCTYNHRAFCVPFMCII